MDCCLFYSKPRFPFPALPSIRGRLINLKIDRRPLVAVAHSYNNSDYKCEFGGLNTPLEPKTAAGRFLCGVLLNDREYFHAAVRNQLEQLVADRDEAVARAEFSLGSDIASLHRRIAELKKHECETAVEDVMYMLIFYKFMEIRVHLVPRLSKCVYNGRLEICPSKDWELESIHDFEVLEMVKEHITAAVGRKATSNVTDSWTTTEIPRLHLCRLYAASILYGYFLKTALFRYRLERSLDLTNLDFGTDAYCQLPLSEMSSFGSKYIAFGRTNGPNSTSTGQVSCSLGKKHEKLRCYVMGFDPETVQMCAKPKSKEALNLIERHCCALFGDENTGLLETDNSISTSFASLKRFVLEAVAYGSFLWDAEECVNAVYKLEEN
ncbi:Hypothetical predicted protein [Olea europaea subsp. europaea]|uniref:UV-B-induced protein At3g17800, chloroplastic-like n=1 Tax=Olea europaea subsp. europaea TaxID=158383 RepID=A0A8S0PAI4_OLEEU|nr:Hypothetical predicted protein [Olea europaea subsp. europaea]